MLRRLLVAVLAMVAVAAMGQQAQADVSGGDTSNLVVNGGFETGNLTGWTLTPASDGSGQQGVYALPSTAYSGSYAWYIGAFGTVDDVISQTLDTIPGTQYLVQFYYKSSGSHPSDFNASWDGASLFSVSNPPSVDYVQYSFVVTGTGSDTISFGGYDNYNWDWLDDVSVSSVPEPVSIALLGAGLAGFGMLRRRRGC
jgi:hypothetical protein